MDLTKKHIKATSIVIIVASIAIAQALFILAFHKIGPYADQWDLIPILNSYFSKGDWISLTTQLHGGHYHTTAYLIMVPLAAQTGWSLFAETIVIIALNSISFILLWRTFLSLTSSQVPRLTSWLVITFSSLYFSFSHGENALWSWQIAVYLVILGLTLTTWSLSRQQLSPISLSTALIGAVVASYAFATGFAIWPIGVLLIALHANASLKTRLTYLFVWLIIGLTISFVYLSELSGSGMSSSANAYQFSQILLFLAYYIGTPLAYFSRDLSLVIATFGVLSFFCLLWALRHQTSASNLALISSLALFSITAGVLVAFGRLDFGIEQARSYRYIIFSQFFWLSLILLFIQAQKNKYKLRGISIAVGLILALNLFNGQKIGRKTAETSIAYNSIFAELDVSSQTSLSNLVNVTGYPREEILLKRLEVMDRHKLSLYRD